MDWACVPDVSGVDARDHEHLAFTGSVDEPSAAPSMSQDLLLLDAETAAETFADLQDQIRQCAPAGEGPPPRALDDSAITGVGDDAWIFRYLDPMEIAGHPAGELAGGFVTIALVRTDDLVSVTVRVEINTEAHRPPDYRTPAQAMDRACGATFGVTCVGDPEATGLSWYPVTIDGDDAPEATDEWLLTEQEINPVAASTRSATLSCPTATHEQIIEQPVALDLDVADEALAWTVRTEPGEDDPGSEPFFAGVGIARSGNMIVVVTLRSASDPTDGDWAGYAEGVLERAVARAEANR